MRMNIIDVIHEEHELDRLLFREGMSKMHFVKIGKIVINLDNVTEVLYQPQGGLGYDKACVLISFVGTNDYAAIYKDASPEAFSQLMTWMDEQPELLQEEA